MRDEQRCDRCGEWTELSAIYLDDCEGCGEAHAVCLHCLIHDSYTDAARQCERCADAVTDDEMREAVELALAND